MSLSKWDLSIKILGTNIWCYILSQCFIWRFIMRANYFPFWCYGRLTSYTLQVFFSVAGIKRTLGVLSPPIFFNLLQFVYEIICWVFGFALHFETREGITELSACSVVWEVESIVAEKLCHVTLLSPGFLRNDHPAITLVPQHSM